MEKWIAYFGVMGSVLNDNGGEFTGEEIKEVKDILNVVDLTTGAESPWQNGLCEKNHQIVDTMLERLIEDYPETPTNILLSWSNMAKNSMQNVYGYSPHQLVYGTNPNLPNIMTNGLPAWEVKTQSEIFAMHLNALHASRRAFIQTENCARIKKALMARVSTNNTIFTNGDRVWYKRERDGKWKGPAKVIFQDGKVIWVRHGSSSVRVSVNRIVKQGEELYDESTKMLAHEEEVTDNKYLGNKVVEVDDTNTEDSRKVLLEEGESIENILDERGGEGVNQNMDSEGSNNEMNLEELGVEGEEANQQVVNDDEIEEDTDKTIVTADNKRKRNVQDDENSVNKRSKVMSAKQYFPPSKGTKMPRNRKKCMRGC